jgi:cobalt-zinc-cadmium efflux system outer membrane protein
MIPTRSVTPDRTSGPLQTDAFLSYPIDWFLFGKRAAAMASARLGVRQSEADYADLIRQRVVACATAFYNLVEARELLKLAHEDVANLRKVEAITEKATKAGNRTKVDLERVRLDMLRSEQAVRDAESAVAVAKATLRSLLGRTDADPVFDIEADIDAPLTAERIPLESAYALARENRPDIKSLEIQVARADADIVVEDRKRFPEVAPSLGYTRQFQGPALGQIDANTWNVSLTSTLPVCNRNQGNRMKARSVAVQNRFLLTSAQVDLRAEVTQVFQEFETAEKNAHAIAQDQKKAAKDVLDAITKSYEAVGGRPYVDVLDAQRNYRETYRAYISSRANYWRAVYRFSAAIGKQITPP